MYIFLMLLAFIGCSDSPRTEDVKIPESVRTDIYQPVHEYFGYNPELAQSVYRNPELQFVNFDPSTSKDHAEALGRIVANSPVQLPVPSLFYEAMKSVFLGSRDFQFRLRGGVPSPFEYQLMGDADGLPMSNNANISVSRAGSSLVTNFNCFACHANVVGNQVVGGAPNSTIGWATGYSVDQQDYKREYKSILEYPTVMNVSAKLALLLDHGTWPTPNMSTTDIQTLRSTMRAMETVAFPVMLGDIPIQAQNLYFYSPLVTSLMKQGGATFDDWETSETVLNMVLDKLYQDAKTLPLSTPRAWWAHRYSGTRGPPKYTPLDQNLAANDFSIFFSFPNMDNPLYVHWDDRKASILDMIQYMDLIESPRYEVPVDQALADIGHEVYQASCAGCHGSFEVEDGNYRLDYSREKSTVPLDKVMTDPKYSEKLTAILVVKNIIDTIEQAQVDPITVSPVQNAYEAPPLVGIWATAPYLHNNSVPNLYQVLNSAARPDYWEMSNDPFAYDYVNAGVKYTERGPDAKGLYVYNTKDTDLGTSNQGHYFGDLLTDFERYAIIEFLKTLGTHNVKPNPLP